MSFSVAHRPLTPVRLRLTEVQPLSREAMVSAHCEPEERNSWGPCGKITLKAFHSSAQGSPTKVGLPWVVAKETIRTLKGFNSCAIRQSRASATLTGLISLMATNPRVGRPERPTLGCGVQPLRGNYAALVFKLARDADLEIPPCVDTNAREGRGVSHHQQVGLSRLTAMRLRQSRPEGRPPQLL